MLRRILAITLLIAFGFPIVAPAFAAAPNSEASLPACCRTHGAHHCAMLHVELSPSSGPSLNAPPCPCYPAPSTAPRTTTASLTASPHLTTQQNRSLAPLTATPRRAARPFLASANLKRGPPASSPNPPLAKSLLNNQPCTPNSSAPRHPARRFEHRAARTIHITFANAEPYALAHSQIPRAPRAPALPVPSRHLASHRLLPTPGRRPRPPAPPTPRRAHHSHRR